MGFAAVHSRAVWGLQSPRVTVEVHLANGYYIRPGDNKPLGEAALVLGLKYTF